MAPPAQDRRRPGRPRPARRVQEPAIQVAEARRSDCGSTHDDGRGARSGFNVVLRERLESWACGGRDGPTTGSLPPPCDLLPCSGLMVLQLAGLAHADCTRSPKGVHHLLLARGGSMLRQLGPRHRTQVRLLLGPVSPDSPSQLDLRVAGPGVWPGGGSWNLSLETRHRTQVRLRLRPVGLPIST